LGDPLNGQIISLPRPLAGELARAQEAWRSKENTRRVWSKDASLIAEATRLALE